MSCVGVASGFPCAGERMLFAEHEDARLRLRLRGAAQVDGHLVAVEVRVERVADERVDLDRLALDEHRLEGLDRGGAASARGSGEPGARR